MPAWSNYIKNPYAEQDDENKQLTNAATRIVASGAGDQDANHWYTPLTTMLDWLSRPGYAASGMINEFIDKGKYGINDGGAGATPDKFDPLAAFGRGWTKKETISGADLVNNMERMSYDSIGMNTEEGRQQMADQYYESPVIKAANYIKSITGQQPVTKEDYRNIWNSQQRANANVYGFAMDVANPLDVSNYLGFGLDDATKLVGKGSKGMTVLEKAFGTKAGEIANLIGDVSDVTANSVGKLSSTLRKMALESDDGVKLLPTISDLMKQGLDETGMKLTSRLPYGQGRRISIGLESPFTQKNLTTKIPIPGTEYITAPISSGWNKLMATKPMQALGKSFDNHFVPNTVPDSVVVKNITSQNLSDLKTGNVGDFVSPMNADELTNLENMVSTITKTTDDINFREISKQTGIKSGKLMNFFEKELPFTMNIQDIYRSMIREGASVSEQKAVFTRAVKLRKVMDNLVDDIPDDLISMFKGTVMNPSVSYKGFRGSGVTKDVTQGSGSKYLNYVFDYKGIDVMAGVNVGTKFNANVWDDLRGTILALDELPENTLQSLKDSLQISPVSLGSTATGEIAGYNHGSFIALRTQSPENILPHEYGHVWDWNSAGKDPTLRPRYSQAVNADGQGYISNYVNDVFSATKNADKADLEDFADSMQMWLQDPQGFAQLSPQRAAILEEVLKDNKITDDELTMLLDMQKQRFQKVTDMMPIRDQIQTIIKNIDGTIADVFDSKFGFTSGEKVFQDLRQGLTEAFERSSRDSEQFLLQVESIFKDVPLEERKKIMDIAAQVSGIEEATGDLFKTGNSDVLFKTEKVNNIPVYHVTLPETADEIMANGEFPKPNPAQGKNEMSNNSLFFAPDPYSSYRWTEQVGIDDEFSMIRGLIKDDGNLRITDIDSDEGLSQIYQKGKELGLTDEQLIPVSSADNWEKYLDDLDESQDVSYSSQITAFVDWAHDVGFKGKESELLGDVLFSMGDEKELAVFDPKLVQDLKSIEDTKIEDIVDRNPYTNNSNEPNRIHNIDKEAFGDTYPYLFKTEPNKRWTTKMENDVLPKMGGSMPVDQFRNLLKSQQVKEDELKWLNVEDLLKGKQKVSKAEVEEWLKWNNLKVEEVVRSESNVAGIPKTLPAPEAIPNHPINNTDNLVNRLFDDWNNNPDSWGEYDNDWGELDENGLDEYGDTPIQSSIGNMMDDVHADGHDGIQDFDINTEDGIVNYLKYQMAGYGVDGPIDENQAREIVNWLQEENFGDNINQGVVTMVRGAPNPRYDANMPPMYKNYTQPGGEDYTELVFKLPDDYSTVKAPNLPTNVNKAITVDQFTDRPWYKELVENNIDPSSRWQEAKRLSNNEDYDLIDDLMEDISDEAYDSFTEDLGKYHQGLVPEGTDVQNPKMNEFIPPHWNGEPNVFAHTRFDTRYTSDGEKVLFVDEIQSDWHQAGRDKGYKGTPTKLSEDAQAEIYRLNEANHQRANEIMGREIDNHPPTDEEWDMIEADDDYMTNNMTIRQLQSELDGQYDTRVPDAPFKKNWDEYVTKRLMQWAVENDYDRIAWSTGKQQADRWHQELADNIDTLQYNQTSKSLTGYKDGERVINKTVDSKELADLVGGDIAKRLTDTKVPEYRIVPTDKLTSSELFINQQLEQMPDDLDPIQIEEWLDKQDRAGAYDVLEKPGFKVEDQYGNQWAYVYPDEASAQKAVDDLISVEQNVQTVSGTNMTIGAEGFRYFYDNKIPQDFQKMSKKFGIKVEPAVLNAQKEVLSPARYLLEDPDFYDGFYDNLSNGFEEGVPLNTDKVYQELSYTIDALKESGTLEEGLSITTEETYQLANKLKGMVEEITGDLPESADFNTEEMANRIFREWGSDMKINPKDLKTTMTQQSIKLTPELKENTLGKPIYMFKTEQNDLNKLTDGLSEDAKNALNEFIKWRESVIKEYTDAQIPIGVLDKYVPFVPQRGLKWDEAQGLMAMFGTNSPVQGTGDATDAMLSYLAGLDPNMNKRTTQALRPAEVNKVLGKEWLTEDAAIAMSVRGTRAIKAKEVGTFLNGFVAKYGITPSEMTDLAGGLPQGYKMYMPTSVDGGKKILKEVTSPVGMLQKGVDGIFLPEEMANVYNEYADLIFGEKSKSALLNIYDTATSLYKKAAYLWNPGHIPNDLKGNIFNNYLMGLSNPMYYVDSVKYLSDPEQIINFQGKQMKAGDLIEQARQRGVLEVGGALAETPSDILDRISLKGGNKITNFLSKYSKFMRKATLATDSMTRFASFLWNLDQGKSLDEAATTVKKYLFDYFDLTPFERKVMKRVIPFYTFMRKNIPLQIETLIAKPYKYAKYAKAVNAIAGGPVDYDNEPEYVRDAGAFPVEGTDYYVAPNLPLTDLNKLEPSYDSLGQLLSSLNPIIKTPVELATNKQLFSGDDIEDYSGQTQDMPLAGFLRSLNIYPPEVQKRGVGYLLDQVPVLRNLDRLTNPYSTRRNSAISSQLTGSAIYSRNSVKRANDAEKKRYLNELIRKLKAKGVNVPTVKDVEGNPYQQNSYK